MSDYILLQLVLIIITFYLLSIQTSVESIHFLSLELLCTHKPHQGERPPAWRGHVIQHGRCHLNTVLISPTHTICEARAGSLEIIFDGLSAIPSLGFTTERYAQRKRWKRSRHHYSFDSDGCSLNFG